VTRIRFIDYDAPRAAARAEPRCCRRRVRVPRTWTSCASRDSGLRRALLMSTCHIPARRADSIPRLSHAQFTTSTTHKTCASRGGLVLAKAEHAKAVDKTVFRASRAAPDACHRRQGRGVPGGSRPPSRIPGPVLKNAKALAAELSASVPIVSGGTDNHLMLLDLRSRA